MRAGPLRHRVTIQRNIDARSASGAVLDLYENWLERIAAAVEPINGTERWVQAQPIADLTARIRIRYREGITAKMRVIHQRESGSPTLIDVYDIEAAVPADGRKIELYLLCRKRDAEGFRTGDR
jgi:SPP1 family predicted phage head-tail adaptor